MRTHEGWAKAKDIREFYAKHKGERYSEYMKKLTFVELDQAAYGDWTLYVDEEGEYYENYFSIGD